MSKVFKFTLAQLFKNKSNRIVFGILFAVLILAVPVASIFLGDGGAADVGGPAEIYTYADTLESYMENGPDDFDTRYAVQYGYSVLVMIICVFSATYIVRAIVEEKSSKLVETLLVSIKSETMIFGKLLAAMVFMIGMIIAAAAAFALSYVVTGLFTDVSFIGDVLAGLTAALTARVDNESEAAVMAVRLHGLSGDYAAKKYGMDGMTASDIMDALRFAEV